MTQESIGERELQLVCSWQWAVQHPMQARSLYREIAERHLGINQPPPQPKVKARPKPQPKVKAKPKPKSKRKPRKRRRPPPQPERIPVTDDGEVMVRCSSLSKQLGIGHSTLSKWARQGHIRSATSKGGSVRYVSESDARAYQANHRSRGRPKGGGRAKGSRGPTAPVVNGVTLVHGATLQRELGLSRHRLTDWHRVGKVGGVIQGGDLWVDREEVLSLLREPEPPVTDDGEVMVKTIEVRERLGLAKTTLEHWAKRGWIRSIVRQETTHARQYVSESDVVRHIQESGYVSRKGKPS